MSILKSIFQQNKPSIADYNEFWAWFQTNEKDFYNIVKNQGDIEEGFFDKLSPKLAELKDGFFFLAGMLNDETAELIITADGNIKNIVFVEELVQAAPEIEGWKFTSLKPGQSLENANISMGGYQFNGENLSFYSNDLEKYPDEISITVVYNDFIEEDRNSITTGIYIFLDTFLGELNFLNTIDDLRIVGPDQAEKELVPIKKLKDFLNWRQKEFIEKYEGVRYDTEQDRYSSFEAELKDGSRAFAIINTDLLKWDSTASHPWISILTFKYDGSETHGMPSEADFKLLDDIEDQLILELKDADGYLNIGRQTANGEREIYFACKDFYKPSIVFYNYQQHYSSHFEIKYDIYKDKYWQSFEKFNG